MNYHFKSQHNSTWILVFSHDALKPNPWFNSETVLLSDFPQNGQYSLLSNLESFRYHGYFEFLLEYPEITGFNRWTQSSNPVLSSNVIDYHPVGKLSWDEFSWGGLALSSNPPFSLIDGTPSDNSWFYAIGQFKSWEIGILAGPTQSAQISKVKLWCRIEPFSNEHRHQWHLLKSSFLFLFLFLQN